MNQETGTKHMCEHRKQQEEYYTKKLRNRKRNERERGELFP